MTHNICNNMSRQPQEHIITNEGNSFENNCCCEKNTMDSFGHTEDSNQGKISTKN